MSKLTGFTLGLAALATTGLLVLGQSLLINALTAI